MGNRMTCRTTLNQVVLQGGATRLQPGAAPPPPPTGAVGGGVALHPSALVVVQFKARLTIEGNNMTKNTPEFVRSFVQEIVRANADDPLVFIEILARLAKDDPVLQETIIGAMKVKKTWYETQAKDAGEKAALDRAVKASGKGAGN